MKIETFGNGFSRWKTFTTHELQDFPTLSQVLAHVSMNLNMVACTKLISLKRELTFHSWLFPGVFPLIIDDYDASRSISQIGPRIIIKPGNSRRRKTKDVNQTTNKQATN